MRELVGSPGTWGSLVLRAAQCSFAGASIGVMVSAMGFSNFTAFCYLIASMGLQLLWSFGLACLDIYALKMRKDLHNPILVSLFVVGDWLKPSLGCKKLFFLRPRQAWYCTIVLAWVTAILSFAAACSAAGVVVLFEKDVNFCKTAPGSPCGMFQLSTALAFLSWTLIAASSLVMFWLLASL